MQLHPHEWKQRLQRLLDIDWSKQNEDWEGVCMVANSVVSNRQARAAKAYIKHKLGLPLTDAELRTLGTPVGRDAEDDEELVAPRRAHG